MTIQYNLSEEEYNLAKKQAISSVRVVKDEDSELRKQTRYQQEEERYRKEMDRYNRQLQAALERDERIQSIKFNAMAQGRDKLLKVPHESVLFEAPSPCPFCDAMITKPEFDKFNPNLNITQYRDKDATWNVNEQDDVTGNYTLKHECVSDNPVEYCKILQKQIAALNDKLNKQAEYNDRYYHHMAKL